MRARLGRVSIKLRRVSRAPVPEDGWNRSRGYPADRLYDLLDGHASPGAKVDRQAFSSALEVLERFQVGAGQIADVDIVAHASAVRRIIVRAEDLDFVDDARCRHQHSGNQMRFR